MKKVIRLVNVQIWAMLANMLSVGDLKKKKVNVIYAGIVLFTVVLGGTLCYYAYFVGSILKAYNSIEVLPSLFMAFACIMVLFTTLYKVKGTLFGFKDFDLLMSMPVSNGKIVASRIMLLYVLNFVFVFITMGAVTVVYGILARPGLIFYLFNFLAVFLLPLIPIIIASVLGTILSFISIRLKYSNIIYIVLVFLLVLVWMFLPFSIDTNEALAEASKAMADRINTIYPLAGLYSKAVTQGNIMSMIIFAAVSILAFMLFTWGIGKIFVKLNTEVMAGSYKAAYKLGELNISSPLMALYKKEFKRYFASPVYVLNTGFGMALLLILTVCLPFIDMRDLMGDVQLAVSLKEFVPLIILFCMATTCTTMASVSMEGKNLWILKSIPVSAKTIFASKILVNLTLLSPSVLASVIIGIILKFSFIDELLVLLLVVSFALFVPAFGLVINLSFPNLTWTNETVVVKQSTASVISIFSCIGLVAVFYGLIKFTDNFYTGALLFICLIWILNIIIYKVLTEKGVNKFIKL